MNVSSFYSKRRVVRDRVTTLREALETVETSSHPTSIVVLPPAAADSAVDSDLEEVSENLRNDEPFETAGELEVEVDVSDDDAIESSESDVESPPMKKVKTMRGKTRGKSVTMHWDKKAQFSKTISPGNPPTLADQFTMLMSLSPHSIWSIIFDNNMVDEIVKQSMLYASRDKNDQQFTVTAEEICQFIGILILSGYHSLPRESDYWSSQQDLGVPVVSQAMSSKRYQTIKRYIHLADNRQLPCWR